MSAQAPSEAPVASGILRRLVRTTLVAAMVLLPVVVVCVVLAVRTPAWWMPISRQDAAATERGAQLEQSIVAEFTRVRSDAPEWSLRIRDQDANEWLATRLPQWLESRGVTSPGPVQARFGQGWIRVGVELPQAVAWWQGAPRAMDGGWRVEGLRAGIGRLPLPGTWVTPTLDLQRLNAPQPIRLADGRQIRVLDLEVLPGEIRLRLRTEPAQASGPTP
jgi:hypothetical protein